MSPNHHYGYCQCILKVSLHLAVQFSSYSAQEWERSVHDYRIVISQIPFVMDILPGWKSSSIFKVKNIFSSHLETI